jgi:signal transduction histidine kinase
VLRVSDNGIGIRPGTRRSGLANMAERAERLGGSLLTAPAGQQAGTGTSLEWRVPLAPLSEGVSRGSGAAATPVG